MAQRDANENSIESPTVKGYGNHCAIVEDSGPDVKEQESGIIGPFGVCTLWHPNEWETR